MKATEFKEKLVDASLTEEHFAKLTNTPMTTIKNWFAKRKGIYGSSPKWVEPYLDLYIENHENKIHIKKLNEKLNEE